jgi:alpha-mannosidase
MYETCHHKYAALTDGRNGIAVLNDCKFGISAKDSRLSLTLLKAPVMPDMQADMGEHEISYALYLFEGPFQNSNVPKKGYEYNLEPTVVQAEMAEADATQTNKGAISFFQMESPSVMIDTCKPAMDMENGVVLRLYEYMGSAVDAKLYVPAEVQKIFVTNMLEDKKQELQMQKDGNGQYVDLAFGAFEIQTLLLEV